VWSEDLVKLRDTVFGLLRLDLQCVVTDIGWIFSNRYSKIVFSSFTFYICVSMLARVRWFPEMARLQAE